MPGRSRQVFLCIRTAAVAFTLIVMFCGCQSTPAKNSGSPEALRKAELLQEKLRRKGLPVPHTDTLIELYGTNGGVAAVYSGSDFQIHYNLVHLGNTGRRPVYLDPAGIAYDEAVLEVYAPENLDDYREAVREWRTEELLPERQRNR